MIKLAGLLGGLLGSLIKTELLLIKNVIKPLAKSILIPLGLTAAASAADAAIHKNVLGLGHHPSYSVVHNDAILIISNDEMKDIIKIVKSLEDSSFLPEWVSETIQNEAREQRWGFLSTLLGTPGASLLGNILTVKGAIAKSVSKETKSKRQGRGINRAGERHGHRIVRAGYGSNSW